MNFEVQDVDGNVADMNDQGEVLDASHSQEEAAATEQESAPRADETSQAQVKTQQKIDYEKSYKELERTYTRDRQQLLELQKAMKEQYEPYKDKLQSWSRADQLLSQDQQAFQYLQARLQGLDHNQAQSFAAESQSNPHMSALMQKLQNVEKYVGEMQSKEVEGQARSTLDQQESSASQLYQKYFGKEMGESEKTEMYNWMVQNDIFNGEAAIKSLYAEKYAEAYAQKMLQDQKAKGQKVVQRTGTMNSSTAKAPSKAPSFYEAFHESLKELRGEH